MASGIISVKEHNELMKKRKKKDQEVKQPSGIVSSDNYNFVAKQILDPISSSSSTIGIDDIKSFNDIQQYAYTNQKSYKEQEKEYEKSVEKTNKDRASLLNKGSKLGIDYANKQGGFDVGIKYNEFEKPTEKSVSERNEKLPLYVKLAEKSKPTNKNRIDIPLSPENTSLTEGRPVYENKEKRKEAITKETERQQKAYDENIKDSKELKDFKDRILKKNAVLEYSKNVAKSREDTSNSGKYTSPFMSGLDNALTPFQNNKFEDANGNIISLPTYNDIRASEFREKSDSKIYKAYSDVSQSVGNMVPGIAAGTISGGLGSGVFFTNTYANAKNQALLEGHDESSAATYALVNAGLELGVGKLLGGASAVMGKSPVAKKIGEKFTSKFMSNPVLASITADMVSEFGEEYVQEWLDPKVQAFLLDHKSIGESWDSSSFIDKQNLYAGFLGALSAGVMNAPGAVSQQLNLNKQIDYLNKSAEQEKGSKLTDAEKKAIKESFYNEYNKSMKTKSNVDYEETLQNSGVLNETQKLQNNDNNILEYSNKEVDNFKNSKIQVVKNMSDVSNFVKNIKSVPNNAKLYFGKISENLSNKIKSAVGIDLKNYNISLKADNIKHILKKHGTSKEVLRGQVPVTNSDFELIPEIVSKYDSVEKGYDTNEGKPSLTFKKQIGDNYYLVNYVSDKKHNLEVQTMWKQKKNSATADNTQMSPIPTSETNSGTSSYIDNNNTNNQQSQIIPTQNNNAPMQENIDNNTINVPKTNKTMNPNEISQLTQEDADTTPNLPTKNRNKSNDGDSQFFDNILYKTDMLDTKNKKAILSDQEVKTYDKVTNKESLERAYEKLNKDGAYEANRWFRSDSKDATATDVAEGWILLKQYADRGDTQGMVEVAKKMRDIGTKAGQTVQAFNIMERMTPEGMVAYAQSELSEAYDNMIKNKSKDWIDRHRGDFELKPSEVQFIMDNMQEISKMEDGYEKRVKLAEIQKMMTDKLPAEKGRKIKSWMRISMLFNPKTQVRNVAGNAIIMPVNSFSDLFASYADKLIAKKSGVRTTGTTNVKAMLEGMKRGAREATNDYRKGINTRDMEGNRFEIGEGKSFSNENLMGKSLNAVDGMLNYVMDVGDRVFSEAAFENSLKNQMKLNNTTEITQEMIDIARSEALQRTWNDNNNYTRFVLNVRKGLNKVKIPGVNGYGLGDVLIPFAKTPANLTKAIVDYSPVGLVNALVEGNNLRKALNNGQFTSQMQHKFVQDLGKATAGTMLYVLGAALAKSGVITGESDDDKDTKDFLKNALGVNSYSIKIGDKSFTYDWAQPIAAPFSIMANVEKKKDNKQVALGEAILSSLDSASSILLEQSFLQSVNEVLTNNKGIASGIENVVLDLPARSIPTFLKQVTDMVDGTQRQTFEYEQPLQTAVNKFKAKLPGLSQTLAPKVDTMGREVQKFGGKNNIFNVFLNPANVNTENISDGAKEIYRLYESTGEKDVMPRVAPYYINSKNEKVVLNTKEIAEYQKISGDIIEKSMKKLINTDEYKEMNDTEKADVVKNIVNYAYNIAKKDVTGLDLSKSYEKAYEYSKIGDVKDYYLLKGSIDNTNKDTKRRSITNYLLNSDLSNKQLSYLYGNYYSSEKELNNILNAGIPMKEFIKFDSQDFDGEFDESKGRTKTNSRKYETLQYIQSLKLSAVQKALLAKSKYSSYTAYDKQIAQYIQSRNLSLLDKYKLVKYAGFKSYDKQIADYIANSKMSSDEKQKLYKDMGFTTHNGRVYVK